MPPAFPSNSRAVAFGCVLLFFLTLPVTLHLIGRVSLEEAYRGISEQAGPVDLIRRQIFEERADLDVVMCGSSLLRNALDADLLQREFSRVLEIGRAHV